MNSSDDLELALAAPSSTPVLSQASSDPIGKKCREKPMGNVSEDEDEMLRVNFEAIEVVPNLDEVRITYCHILSSSSIKDKLKNVQITENCCSAARVAVHHKHSESKRKLLRTLLPSPPSMALAIFTHHFTAYRAA